MKVKKLLALGATALLSTFVLAGCGNKSSDSSKSKAPSSTVKIMTKDVIATMDSSLNTDVIGSQAATNTMEGLYRYEGKTVKPGIATKVVKPTNNGLTYTFPLRNTKWSNGDPVTADDFVFAWRRTVDPKTKSQYAYIYEGIANAKDITAGKKSAKTLGVKAVDKHTLQVTLEKPIPYFNKLMTCAFYFPQNQKVVEKWGKKYGTNSKTLVFNGPYKLVNWDGPDNTWNEVKNKDYWNAKNVKVKKLQYQVVKDPTTALNLYQSNKLDDVIITGDNAKQMRGSKGYNSRKMNSTFYIAPNLKRQPLFKNKKIRQAISLSINRPQMTKKVLGDGSQPADSFMPRNMATNPTDKSKDFVDETKASAAEYAKYDPKEAKKLWKQGLAETGNTGKKFNFAMLGDDTDAAKKLDEFLQNQLEELPGLKVTLNNVPFKTRLSRSDSGDFDMVVTAWNADFPDPINFLTLMTSKASYNFGKWKNSKFDDLVDKSMMQDANDPSKRWQDMKEAQDVLNKEQGVVPLYQVGEAHMTKSKVKNMTLSPNGSYNMVSVRVNK
ncbi:peptide ABC transporter substrate-binding protein [Lactobacillus sp. ESL0681]|uniref:peptide ABC transporter substrate-binding protein n=1 Tax=Lactobacillus sp. ESL0681 TaxID=2983211 RepID=UPI0023F97454|nr:peptide ABC transporter substrate-binding protein [Lactobacillus sp. ESL0681]WEV40162.1 peptide ABC transporter substrate-binding protein [Lactobacillus sp. ESL0681]